MLLRPPIQARDIFIKYIVIIKRYTLHILSIQNTQFNKITTNIGYTHIQIDALKDTATWDSLRIVVFITLHMK